MTSRLLFALPLALALLACRPARPGAPRLTVLEARVTDGRGAVWSAAQSPRRAHVVMQLSPVDARVSGRVFWLRGDADGAVLEDLADPPLREATLDRLLAASVEPTPGGCEVQLDAPLAPGSQSTLVVWTGDAADADAGLGWWTRSLRVSASPLAGARFAQSLPPDGARGVSPATRRALLRWDGRVEGLAEASASLRAKDSERALALQPFDCDEQGLPAGSCAWVSLQGLTPDTDYTLHLTGRLQDATGDPLPSPRVAFSTHAQSQAPTLQTPSCGVDERATPLGCARATRTHFVLRTATRSPALLELRQGDRATAAIAGGGPVQLELPVAGPGEASLEARDLTGRAASHTVQVWREHDLPRLRLSEVLAAPLGSDAHSEYVEVVNDGEQTWALDGWSLARAPDSEGRVVTGGTALPPAGRALLVGPDFDAKTLSGLPEGLPRLALSGTLSLPDAGGTLLLRDARGRRVDALEVPATAGGRCALRAAGDGGMAWVGPCSHPEVSAR